MKELYDPPKNPVTYLMRSAPQYEIDVQRDLSEDWETEYVLDSYKQAITQCARLELKIDIEAVSLWARYPGGDPIEIPNSAWLNPEPRIRWQFDSIEADARWYAQSHPGKDYVLHDPWCVEMRMVHLGLPMGEKLWQWIKDETAAGRITNAEQNSNGQMGSRPMITCTYILKDGMVYHSCEGRRDTSCANAVWFMMHGIHGQQHTPREKS